MKSRILLFILANVGQLSPIQYAAGADRGFASIYTADSGSGTASGQKLNPHALTAAHRTFNHQSMRIGPQQERIIAHGNY